MYKILRYLYSLFFILALPVIFLRLLWRSRKAPAYRRRWLERLGIFACNIKPGGLWLHAVSVGEVVAALPLIKSLQKQYPNLALTITTTTPTGSQRVQQSLGASVTHVYLPYDIIWALQSFVRKIQPQCLVVMETELWPNLFEICQQRNIPIVIVNGRLSDKSFKPYSRLRWFMQPMFDRVNFVAAQSDLDADRFKQIGVASDKLLMAGNLKYDVQVTPQQQELGQQLRQNIGQRLVWVMASTHAGEEEMALDAFANLQNEFPNLLLILVPRHPERFNSIAELIEQRKLRFVRRSQNPSISADTQVLLGDTMGEMNVFYAAADLAFVGGSLVPIGGHNLLEPAALGIATITGPYMSNFIEITNKLLQSSAVIQVSDAEQMQQKLRELLADTALRQQMGQFGLQVIAKNRGANERIMQIIKKHLT